ncbi:hypothetical protein EV586_10939 [Tumebacillus sp. BK434]|nr:hypothetical protein EV586_10939 [Tumebacillus sp. BK434]
MRLFEFGNIAWTTSAQNADSLKRRLLQNYGHAGPEFVQFLLKLPFKRLYRKWEYYCQFIRQKIQNADRFTNRITDKFAILLVTAYYAKKALGLAIDRKKIRELLLQQIQENSEERDIGKRALEYFKQTVLLHSDNFTTRGREFWVLIKRKNGHPHEVLILPIQFKKILEAGGFGDSHQVILKNWATRGWLDCDKDEFTKKRTLESGSLHTRVHVVLLQNESARE